jgi:hypothetical protein
MRWKTPLAVLAVAVVLGGGVFWKWGSRIEFVVGGALVDLGYRLQDPLEDYDFEHHHPSAVEVWDEFLNQNKMASSVRARWPRTARHPVVAMVACMDGRLDTNEIAGDTRRYYYVLRLAGSVISEVEEEMLELAVSNGVKVVVFTTHSDCAAEKVAKDAVKRASFPNLSKGIDEREAKFKEFLRRPLIQDSMAKNELLVKWMDLDTANERVVPHKL